MALMYQDKVVADVGGGGAGGGGSEYTAGPGIVIEGGEIREKVPVDVLQQAEYDALPEERKQNGVYFLPDGSGDGGVGETSCEEIYTTEERRIGTYLGKPLYQITAKLFLPIGTNVEHIVIPADIIRAENIIACNGWIRHNSNPGLKYILSGMGQYLTAYRNPDGAFAIRLINTGAPFSGQPAEITIKYTKTTDTAQEASE